MSFVLPLYVLAGPLLALHAGSWWLLPIGALGLLVVAYLAAAGSLLLARAGWRGRVLLLQHSAAGRGAVTMAVRREDRYGSPFVCVWNLHSVPSRRAGHLPDRSLRPGAQLMRRVIDLAQAERLSVRFLAANQHLARKVYLPAGFQYDGAEQAQAASPRMVMAATDVLD